MQYNNNSFKSGFLCFLVLNHEGWTNFVSDMPLNLHKTFNEALNKRFADRSLVKTIRTMMDRLILFSF